MSDKPVVQLVPQPARWPWLYARLDHEAAKVARRPDPLNEESLAFAYLYQHAATAARRRLYEALRVNGCACLRCTRARDDLDRDTSAGA